MPWIGLQAQEYMAESSGPAGRAAKMIFVEYMELSFSDWYSTGKKWLFWVDVQ